MNRVIGIALAFCLALVAGCSTVEGMGKDIKRLGDNIEDAAKR